MDTMVKLLSKYQSRITTAIDAGDTSIVVASLTDIPTVPFMAILEDTKTTAECVWVTAVATASKTLTVTRAQRGTTDVAHVAGVLLHHSEVALADLGFFEVWETAGETGRPFESQLITNVLLGNYANAIKGYVDCDLTGGSTGLLSGVNGEIRLPNAAARGAYYGLESEVVFQTNSTITPYGSTAGFLYLGASGAGIADFDTDGVFMTVVGLTPAAGKLLSLDYHTLKCDIVVSGAHNAKYLVLSKAENYLYHDFSALDPTGRIARWNAIIAAPATGDGEGLFNITVSLNGTATDTWALTSTWLNIGSASGKLKEGDYFFLHSDGIWQESASDIANAYIAFQKYEAILDDTPGHLHIWNMNLTKEITALIEVNNPAMLGFEAGTSHGTVTGTVPLYTTGLGATRYVVVYSTPGGG